MPVIIKDFEWRQTPNDIVITVKIPLKNVHESKVDILISSRFVKASYEQYYFEAVLLASIHKTSSKCTLTSTTIVFELKKSEEGDWESLEPNVSKKEKLELKKQFLEQSYQDVEEYEKNKVNKKYELKRLAVKKQIDLDSANRQNLEDVRQMEKKKALGDFEEFRKKVANKLKTSQRKSVKPLPEETKKPEPEVPKVRKTAVLKVNFTPRHLPTPCRESKLEEEHEYLAKQAAARRSVGFVSEDIRPEERNPHFIKAKGDEFLHNKNYLGAISAYSFGIKLSKNFVDFYIGRSEAHMAVENFWKAAQDCSTALELLRPICEANLYERALCTGRRGEALCNLNMKKEGLSELSYSLSLINQQYYREVFEKEAILYKNQVKRAEEERQEKIKEENQQEEKKAEKDRFEKIKEKNKQEENKQGENKEEESKQEEKQGENKQEENNQEEKKPDEERKEKIREENKKEENKQGENKEEKNKQEENKQEENKEEENKQEENKQGENKQEENKQEEKKPEERKIKIEENKQEEKKAEGRKEKIKEENKQESTQKEQKQTIEGESSIL